jgi:hypothetical protein
MPVITPAHLHVLINHLPIMGVPLVALLLAWGLFRRQDAVIRAALCGAVLMAAGSFITDQTGDRAKDNIEHESWYRKDTVHEHEESADFANPAALATGVAALVLLLLARGGKPVSRGGAFGVLLALVLTGVIMARTGYLGGQIRHSEFQPADTTASGIKDQS